MGYLCAGSPPATTQLDECTSALDQDIEHRMLSCLRDLGKTVIIVTHRPAALEVCDRVIQLGE